MDGTGNPWYKADLAVKDGKIYGIGKFDESSSKQVIEGKDRVLAPGFIDMHSHSDLYILKEPEARQKILQGVTTELLGQDGLSIAPVKDSDKERLRRQVSGLLGVFDYEWDWNTYEEYLNKIEELGTSTNIMTLVPYGQIRQWVMGMEDRAPLQSEIEEMKKVCQEAFVHGVVGVSLGLIYPPCVYSKSDELVEVLEVAAANNGFLVCHIRNESDSLLESLDEIISIAVKAGCPLHISHLKVAGRTNWDKVKKATEKITRAKDKLGLQVTFDQYPYFAGSTVLSALIPPWAHAGGTDSLIARLKDKETREIIKREILAEGSVYWENWVYSCGWENIMISYVKSEKNQRFVGKNLKEIGDELGIEPVEATFKLLIEEDTAVSMVQFWGNEDVVKEIMQHPFYTVGTDGLLGGNPHPRLYGSFPRVLGKYVREERVLRLEEAVRHMTSLPAQILGLDDRGVLKKGMAADLVLFDENAIRDTSTYVNPHQFPEGIDYVVVNGEIVVENGRHTLSRPGIVIRHRATVNVME